MKFNLETQPDAGAYFINFTHVKGGNYYHAYVRLDDVVSWESEIVTYADSAEKRSAHSNGQENWVLTTNHRSYKTVQNFNEIMDTCNWHSPRTTSVGSPTGRLDDVTVANRKESHGKLS